MTANWDGNPADWAVDEVPTQAKLRTEIRDRFDLLKLLANDDGSPNFLQSARQSSDLVKTTDVTLEDIPDMSFDLLANEKRLFFALIHFLSPTAADLKIALTVPSGATGRYGIIGSRNEVGVGDAEIGTDLSWQGIDSDDFAIIVGGVVVNSTTPGTAQLQAAQNSSSGTTTIYADGGLVAFKVS